MSDERNWWRRPAVGGELSVSPSEPVGPACVQSYLYEPQQNSLQCKR